MSWIGEICSILSSGFYFVSKKPFASQKFRLEKNNRMDLMLLDRKYREHTYDIAEVIGNGSVYFWSNTDLTAYARIKSTRQSKNMW